MNAPTFVEAARHLAQRLLTEAECNLSDRLTRAFQLALGRPPAPQEVQPLESLLQEQLRRFATNSAEANELLGVGQSKPQESLDAAELAAWTVIASILLNLDEHITKGCRDVIFSDALPLELEPQRWCHCCSASRPAR